MYVFICCHIHLIVLYIYIVFACVIGPGPGPMFVVRPYTQTGTEINMEIQHNKLAVGWLVPFLYNPSALPQGIACVQPCRFESPPWLTCSSELQFTKLMHGDINVLALRCQTGHQL